LEADVKKAPEKLSVKMLGNFKKYESGQVYAVDEAEAVFLIVNGFAVKAEIAEQAKE
jgi:hypothetical protein